MRTQPDFIIRRLEEHTSLTDKESILEDAAKEGLDEFFDGLRMALDPQDSFGIKLLPVKDTDDGQGLSWEVFLSFAEQLRRRELKGHNALDAIQLVMNIATRRQWNDWYRRILMKELQCGVGAKTVNRGCKDYPKYQIRISSKDDPKNEI
jgi:DNA ligase 1